MKLVADLHIHSKYSRAVSPQMVISEIARWAKLKGLDLAAAPDWTHPVWVRELRSQLVETAPGIFKQKTPDLPAGKAGVEELPPEAARKTSEVNDEGKVEPRFLLVTELASIYSQKGRTYKIHNLVLAPSFEAAEKINVELARRGVNLISDGRPISGISARDLAELIFSVDEKCVVIPAHVWTPWFSLYGANSGFDSIEECFGDMSKYIYAVETGLSSDPAMNWRIKELDNRQIVSFSDAHSGANLGREATVFQSKNQKLKIKNQKHKLKTKKISYRDIALAIKNDPNGDFEIGYTIEFYPQEGKYHYTGHRNCGVRHSPEETRKLGETCPVCGKPLTIGVMHRVEKLSNLEIEKLRKELTEREDEYGVKWIGYKNRPAYVMLVPLVEIIAEVKGVGKLSKSVWEEYRRIVSIFGSEFKILLEAPVEEIAKVGGEKLAEGVKKVREGNISIEPGYDGVYGQVKVWLQTEDVSLEKEKEQMSLF